MPQMKDWRPEKLDAEAIATDAHLARIEQKLDVLISLVASGSHAIVKNNQSEPDNCNTCNRALR